MKQSGLRGGLVCIVLVSWSCGGPRVPAKAELAETTGTTSSSAASPANETAVDELALQVMRAAFADDRATVLRLSLTSAQMADLSNKAPSAASYDEELQSFIAQAAREARENPGFKVVSARVAETKKLPPGEKLKREVEFAAVFVTVELNGEQREGAFPLFFIRTEAGWRFTPKK